MTTVAPLELQPRSMGQILDQAIRIYRRNFLRFVGLVAIVQVPLALLQMGLSYLTLSGLLTGMLSPTSSTEYGLPYTLGPGYFLGLLGSVITGACTQILLYGVAGGALSRCVVGQYLGESLTLTGALRRISRLVPRLIGAVAFALVLSLAVGIWSIIPCVGWLSGPGLLAFFFMAVVPLIAPAVVIEGRPALPALRRAWDLVRRRFWWVLGFVLILYLFNLLVVGGPGAIVTAILQAGAGGALASRDPNLAIVVQTVVQTLAALILSLIYLPLQLTCMVLMYLDLRVRTEGLDLALQTARAQPDGAAPEQALAYAPPSGGALITWQEIGYFALVTLGFIALLGFLYAILVALMLIAFAAP